MGTVVTIKKIYTNDQYNRGIVSDRDGKNYEVYMQNLEVLAIPYNPETYVPFIRPKKIELSEVEKAMYYTGEE